MDKVSRDPHGVPSRRCPLRRRGACCSLAAVGGWLAQRLALDVNGRGDSRWSKRCRMSTKRSCNDGGIPWSFRSRLQFTVGDLASRRCATSGTLLHLCQQTSVKTLSLVTGVSWIDRWHPSAVQAGVFYMDCDNGLSRVAVRLVRWAACMRQMHAAARVPGARSI